MLVVPWLVLFVLLAGFGLAALRRSPRREEAMSRRLAERQRERREMGVFLR